MKMGHFCHPQFVLRNPETNPQNRVANSPRKSRVNPIAPQLVSTEKGKYADKPYRYFEPNFAEGMPGCI
jgi:hypothetical protein